MIYASPDSQGIPALGTPEATNGTGTISSPATVSAAINSGDNHIHLLAGLYRGQASMIDIQGRSDFTIMSDHAQIDGEFLNKPMRITDCHNFQIVGINDAVGGFDLFNGPHEVLSSADCTNGAFKGVGVWNDPPPIRENRTNDMVIGLNGCEDLALEGCFAFGYGRKSIQVYRSIRTIVKDGWFRWDDWTVESGNRMAIAPAYQSYDTYVVDCMATCAGSWDPSVIGPAIEPDACQLIANDNFNTSGDIWEKLDDPNRPLDETRIKLVRCTAYQPEGTRYVAGIGIRQTDQNGCVIEDCNVVAASQLMAKTLNLSGTGCSIKNTNIGNGQWAKMRDWSQEFIGLGINKYYRNQLSAELIRRVEQATSQSRWTDVRWPEDFPA